MRMFICTILTWILLSCSGKGKIPGNIIAPVQMKSILKDLFIVDAVNAERVNKETTLKIMDENKVYFEKVLQLHQISREQFEKSYNYYMNHPDVFKEITDSLTAEVNRMSTDAYSDTPKIKMNGRNFKDSARKNRN